MLPKERQNLILSLIEEKTSITSKEIADKLSLSLPTLWRDLKILSQKGRIIKTHGGAVLKREGDFEFLFSTRMKKHISEKKRIAEYASTLINPGDIIALDTGTTSTLFASFLKDKENITVVTTSMSVAQELINAKRIYSILIGGDIKEETMSTTGPMTLQNISNFRVNKYFIGASAINPDNGTQDAYLFEIEIKKALMKISQKNIVLADSSKFGKNSLAVMAEFKEIDTIITDNNLRKEYEYQITKAGVNLIKV
ncbi:MAG: DeoR/GlpR family DNA-binding transcription regulator [bacterium]